MNKSRQFSTDIFINMYTKTNFFRFEHVAQQKAAIRQEMEQLIANKNANQFCVNDNHSNNKTVILSNSDNVIDFSYIPNGIMVETCEVTA